MRYDIENELGKLNGDIKLLNKSELARRLNCSRNTINKYLNSESTTKKSRKIKSKLDDFKSVIIDKVDRYGASSKSIYNFIKKKGYLGKYGTVNNFVKKYKNEEHKKATIRFETNPGLQAQVDWKEKVTMINKHGVSFEVNIFLIVLGYSRQKFVKLTTNRTQKTLFECLFNSFMYYGGVPKEILFDNMSTVVDRKRSTFSNVNINQAFKYFSLDSGFKIVTCRPYRPQTKGKVESLAKLVDRLKVYNEEFETFEDLEKIVSNFGDEINQEVSQATNEKPSDRFIKEKEYLNPLPSMHALLSYFNQEKEYKVSKESMITYKGQKYSVSTFYIGSYVTVSESDNKIEIHRDSDIIATHKKSDKLLNYRKEDAVQILKSDALKHCSYNEIDKFIEDNLKQMDLLIN